MPCYAKAPSIEVKQRPAWLALGWVTTWTNHNVLKTSTFVSSCHEILSDNHASIKGYRQLVVPDKSFKTRFSDYLKWVSCSFIIEQQQDEKSMIILVHVTRYPFLVVVWWAMCLNNTQSNRLLLVYFNLD